MRFTFAILVMGRSGTEGAALLEALHEGGFSLAEDAALWRGDDIVGFARLLTVDELGAMSELPGVREACQVGERPWIGRPVAAFVWSHVVDERLARDELLPRLLSVARGTVIRLDDGRRREPLSLRTFSLDQLLKRYGFDDGAELLSRDDEEYQREVARAMERRLAEAGLDGTVGWFGTHHNPLGLCGDLRRDGRVVSDVEATLAPLKVSFWAWDWSILADDQFWLE
jgi:hypothetical protein